MEVTIEPLEQHTLSHAITLRDQIFPQLPQHEYDTLSASLFPEKNSVHKKLAIKQLNYWIAIHPITLEVIGLVGLYTQVYEDDGMIWLGWYCVNPQYRGYKIGGRLMDFAIKSAKEQGKQTLHLYTTADEDYATARMQYKKIGFVHYKSANNNLYYQLSLREQL